MLLWLEFQFTQSNCVMKGTVCVQHQWLSSLVNNFLLVGWCDEVSFMITVVPQKSTSLKVAVLKTRFPQESSFSKTAFLQKLSSTMKADEVWENQWHSRNVSDSFLDLDLESKSVIASWVKWFDLLAIRLKIRYLGYHKVLKWCFCTRAA